MNIQELIVGAVIFYAIYYIGNRFFVKKKGKCDSSCGDNCQKHEHQNESGEKP
jgi:uncharacterized membrane protein